MAHELIYLDPDFRRDPKTGAFCYVCQRDIPQPRFKVWVDLDCMAAVHPEDAKEPLHALLLIGPECAKKVPAEYLVAIPSVLERENND